MGLTVEQGLAETILNDVEREPGNLPLLELALLETWQNRRGRMLTLEGYRAAGGVQHTLGERAEAVYKALSDASKMQARNLFLRLIQPGEGTQDTRRRVALAEVAGDDDSAVADVLQQFVRARLLTTTVDDATGERRVEIAHEAVITGWRRCAQWVAEDRAGLLIHRRLTAAAQDWRRHGESTDALYRGVQLAEAIAWSTRTPGRLNRLEEAFLGAGRAWSGPLGAPGGAVPSWRLGRCSSRSWSSAGLVALHQRGRRDLPSARRGGPASVEVDPALSVTLALRALDSADTPEADEALRQATGQSRGRSLITLTVALSTARGCSRAGHQAVTGSDDGSVWLWNLADGTLQKSPALCTKGRCTAVRVSPDGRTIASGGRDATCS